MINRFEPRPQVTDELTRLCNETLLELIREYGKDHPITRSVEEQIRSLHVDDSAEQLPPNKRPH